MDVTGVVFMLLGTCIMHVYGMHDDGSGKGCTYTQIEKCYEPIDQYIYRGTSFIYLKYTEKEMHTLCQNYDLVNACLAPFKEQCSKGDLQIFKGEEDALDYVCNEGFDIYMKHRACFVDKPLEDDFAECNDHYEEEFSTLMTEYDSFDDLLKDFCKITREHLKCEKDIANEHCGKEAAEWLHTVNVKYLQPSFNRLDCDLDAAPRLSTPVTIAIIALVLLFAVIVLVALCAYIYKKHQANRRPGNHHARSTVIMPPVPRRPIASGNRQFTDMQKLSEHDQLGGATGGFENPSYATHPEKTPGGPPPDDALYGGREASGYTPPAYNMGEYEPPPSYSNIDLQKEAESEKKY